MKGLGPLPSRSYREVDFELAVMADHMESDHRLSDRLAAWNPQQCLAAFRDDARPRDAGLGGLLWTRALSWQRQQRRR